MAFRCRNAVKLGLSIISPLLSRTIFLMISFRYHEEVESEEVAEEEDLNGIDCDDNGAVIDASHPAAGQTTTLRKKRPTFASAKYKHRD